MQAQAQAPTQEMELAHGYSFAFTFQMHEAATQTQTEMQGNVMCKNTRFMPSWLNLKPRWCPPPSHQMTNWRNRQEESCTLR